MAWLTREKKRVRQYIHLDYYHPTFTQSELTGEKIHIGAYPRPSYRALEANFDQDHCLEYFREAAMCRGDPSITTFGWRDGKPTAHVESDHQCVQWDRLSSWAESRSVNIFDPNILEHEGELKWGIYL